MVRLTDSPDMAIVVYQEVKQQANKQRLNIKPHLILKHICLKNVLTYKQLR